MVYICVYVFLPVLFILSIAAFIQQTKETIAFCNKNGISGSEKIAYLIVGWFNLNIGPTGNVGVIMFGTPVLLILFPFIGAWSLLFFALVPVVGLYVVPKYWIKERVAPTTPAAPEEQFQSRYEKRKAWRQKMKQRTHVKKE